MTKTTHFGFEDVEESRKADRVAGVRHQGTTSTGQGASCSTRAAVLW